MLSDDWYLNENVEKFVEVLSKLGFNCAIKDVAGKPTLVIWKRKTFKPMEASFTRASRRGRSV